MSFRFVHEGSEDGRTITYDLSDTYSLETVSEHFVTFLRAVGYPISDTTTIKVIDESAEPEVITLCKKAISDWVTIDLAIYVDFTPHIWQALAERLEAANGEGEDDDE